MDEKICTLETYNDICPIHDAHDKLEEAYYFLLEMANSYHRADDFRFNLTVFIQSLRGVTFMLQNYKSKFIGFDDWYKVKQEEMKNNPCLKKFCDARTVVVHKRSLQAKSKIEVGVFRGRNIKCIISFENLHPFLDSISIFNYIAPKLINLGLIDKNHSSIGEQLGIRRNWYCDEIGEKEVLSTCYDAYLSMCSIIAEAHSHFNLEFVPQGFPDGFIDNIFLILESDLDPLLPQKWGW